MADITDYNPDIANAVWSDQATIDPNSIPADWYTPSAPSNAQTFAHNTQTAPQGSPLAATDILAPQQSQTIAPQAVNTAAQSDIFSRLKSAGYSPTTINTATGNMSLEKTQPQADLMGAIKGLFTDPQATLMNNPKGVMGALSLLGAAGSLFNKPKQISPAQLQASLPVSPYNNFTPTNQDVFNKFMSNFNTGPKQSTSSGTLVPYGAHGPQTLAHGGQVGKQAGLLNLIRAALMAKQAQQGAPQAPPQLTMSPQGAQAPMGAPAMAHGGSLRLVHGHGDGQGDKVPARLSPGEYVMDADVVSALGNGDNNAGAAKLDQMRENIRAHNRSAPVDNIPSPALAPQAYMRGGCA